MWQDIIAAGIAPGDVRLVACPGGQITTEELLLARALGAHAGWIDPAQVAPDRLDDMLPFGSAGDPPVLELLNDPMTVRAFITPSRLPDELRVAVARYLHQAYRLAHVARKTPGDPALEPWESLLPSLRDSNLAQADDIPNKLAVLGLRLERGGRGLELDRGGRRTTRGGRAWTLEPRANQLRLAARRASGEPQHHALFEALGGA